MMAAYADMMMSLPPQEAGVIALGRRPLAITAEEVEGTPTKPLSVGCPSLVEKSATVINELRPSLLGHVCRHPGGVKSGHCFGPRPPCATIMFHDGRTFLLRIGPNSILVLGLNFRCFRWFRWPPGTNPRIWLTLIDGVETVSFPETSVLELGPVFS